mmetsp:Transcript_11555/g.11573  ORF Transcript_11555/g.11573 Transcript_11555/m.11573 type:complete len:226 (+) Transcript_11555:23-700(+)
MRRFAFIGAPGVGKGSFSKIICSSLKLAHIALGDIIRSEIELQTNRGKKIQSYVQRGVLVPDEIAYDILLDNCKAAIENDHVSGYIIDGFPRTLSQAKFITDNKLITRAVNITLKRSLTIKKLLGRRTCSTCGGDFNLANIFEDDHHMPALLPNPDTCRLGGDACNPVLVIRHDDNEETIRTRFSVFDAETSPILDHFEKYKMLKSFEVRRGIQDADNLMKLMIS